MTIKHETTVREFDTDRQTVTCSDGFSLPYDLLVAADGKNSSTRAFFREQDKQLLVTPRRGRVGEVRYKTFNLDIVENIVNVLEEGWLYGVGGPPPNFPVLSRTPHFNDDGKKSARGVGIIPVNDDQGSLGVLTGLCKSDSDRSLLYRKLPRALTACATDAERDAFETRVLSDASGGFVVSKLYSGHCAFVGDAAVSPAPAGQGVNHALDAAASLAANFDAATTRTRPYTTTCACPTRRPTPSSATPTSPLGPDRRRRRRPRRRPPRRALPQANRLSLQQVTDVHVRLGRPSRSPPRRRPTPTTTALPHSDEPPPLL